MPTLIFYIASYFAILLVAAFAILLLRRLVHREPLFTERDWLYLFGYPRDQAFKPKLLIRFLVALVIVAVVGFALGVFLLPLGMAVFLAAVGLTIGAVVLLAPRFLRLGE